MIVFKRQRNINTLYGLLTNSYIRGSKTEIMKNKILLLVVLLSTFNLLEARTPRVKNKSFSYETIKLPQMALPEARTYTTYLETSVDYGNLGLRYQNDLQIPGWVKSNNGVYAIDVKFFPIDYQRPFIITRNQLVKDTSGAVVDTLWFFSNVFKANGSGSLTVINDKNEAIYNNMLQEVCLQTTGREYRSRRAARRHRAREANQLQQQMVIDFAQAMTRQVNRSLDHLLGIYPIRKRSSLMIVRNKKHREYKLMNEFWDRFQSITVHVNSTSDLKNIEEKLYTEIAYLKNIENKYRGSKKANRKIRYMAFRNLSTIYEMLEMPREAIYYAQKIRSNDFRKFNAGHLIADAQRMKRLQEIHGS